MSASDLFQLSEGVLALLLLAGWLGLHYKWLAHPVHGEREQLRRLVGMPILLLGFLVTLWWAGTHLEQLTWLVPPVELCMRFFGMLVLLETALFPVAKVGRIGAAVALGSRLGLVILAGLMLALLAGIPLQDPYAQRALSATAAFYLLLHLGYMRLFRVRRGGLVDIVRQRVRTLAYLLLLALVGLYLLRAWHLVPITAGVLTDYQVAVGCLLALIFGEAAIALIFDYYFPVLRGSFVAHLYRDMVRSVLYLGLGAILYSWSSGHSLGHMLQDSAYFSVGIGLALKPTLGNLVSGLVLRLAAPYEIGDIIQVGPWQGRVIHLSWRSTDIATLEGDELALPNAMLARMMLINHSRPNDRHAVEHAFETSYKHPPSLVRQAGLAAIGRLDGILATPPPEIWLWQFGDTSLVYHLRFFIADYRQKLTYEHLVKQSLWYEFMRRGIEMPDDNKTAIPQRPRDRDLVRELEELLKSVDFLAALAPAELQYLLSTARLQLFAAGERICEQGRPGNSFYLIKSGRLRVTAVDAQGTTFLSAEMLPGKYFGEMALLTGEPRSASVDALTDAEVFRLHKEDLRKLIQQNPRVEELMSKALARRQLRTEKAREEAELLRAMTPEEERAEASLAEQFLQKMRSFFSY